MAWNFKANETVSLLKALCMNNNLKPYMLAYIFGCNTNTVCIKSALV